MYTVLTNESTRIVPTLGMQENISSVNFYIEKIASVAI